MWKLKKYTFRGLIKAGLCRTLLHIKIRQKLKSATAQPELLGKVRLLVSLSFSFLKACKFHSILSSSGPLTKTTTLVPERPDNVSNNLKGWYFSIKEQFCPHPSMSQWNNALLTISYKSLTLVNSKLVLLVFQMRVLAHWRQSKWLSVVWAQSTSSSDVLLRILLFKTLGDNLAKFSTVLSDF